MNDTVSRHQLFMHRILKRLMIKMTRFLMNRDIRKLMKLKQDGSKNSVQKKTRKSIKIQMHVLVLLLGHQVSVGSFPPQKAGSFLTILILRLNIQFVLFWRKYVTNPTKNILILKGTSLSQRFQTGQEHLLSVLKEWQRAILCFLHLHVRISQIR